MNVSFQIKTEGGLVIETWRFWLMGERLVLDGYEKVRLPSLRHRKGEVLAAYSRLGYSRGRSDTPYGSIIREADVPWDEDIQRRAIEAMVAAIEVVRWEQDLGNRQGR